MVLDASLRVQDDNVVDSLAFGHETILRTVGIGGDGRSDSAVGNCCNDFVVGVF